MKQSTTCPRLKILTVMLLLCLSVVAQPPQDTAVKQELALSVSDGDDTPWEIPAFKGGGAGVAKFRRIESSKASSGEAVVKLIDFKIDREGDIVIAHVSLRLENEKEVIVGTYRLRIGETIKTEELAKFGLEPLALKVVKAKPSFKDPLPPIAPLIENKTKAIEVVSFNQDEHRSEIFQLTLRNISEKNIVALDLFLPSADGNGGAGWRSRGDKSQPVMLPGGTSIRHIGISRGGRQTSEGYIPDAPMQQTLIIRTVVFSDGTYEGLVETAAEMEAQRRGLNIQRTRILPLLQEPKDPDLKDDLTTLDNLKEKAYALSTIADVSVALELMALFPSLNEKSKGSLMQGVGEGLREGKLELLRYLKEFEGLPKQPGEHVTLAQWIKQTKTNYEKLITTF